MGINQLMYPSVRMYDGIFLDMKKCVCRLSVVSSRLGCVCYNDGCARKCSIGIARLRYERRSCLVTQLSSSKSPACYIKQQ